MRRRTFVGAAASALVVGPFDSFAQQTGRLHRIGFLGATSASAPGYAARVEAFRAGLRDLGYVEGQNIVIEYRWAEGQYDLLPGLAAELVRLNVEVIVTHAIPPTLAAKRATTAIPIVMTNVADAVGAGIVASLARPGGNITGDTFFLAESVAKRLEILKDALPAVTQVAILTNPDNPVVVSNLKLMDGTASALRLSLKRFDARSLGDLDNAFAAMSRERVDALAIVEDTIFVANWKRLADLATAQRLPSVGFTDFAAAGGLIGYGADPLVLYRRAAAFVDKILKGAKPADLPIERPTKFVLAINLVTAKRLGLTIPQSVLVRADEVFR